MMIQALKFITTSDKEIYYKVDFLFDKTSLFNDFKSD